MPDRCTVRSVLRVSPSVFKGLEILEISVLTTVQSSLDLLKTDGDILNLTAPIRARILNLKMRASGSEFSKNVQKFDYIKFFRSFRKTTNKITWASLFYNGSGGGCEP